MILSAHLKLLIFLQAVLNPVCDSSNSALHMMYFAYMLNNQGDNLQHCYTPFPILNTSVLPCLVLLFLNRIHASQETSKVVYIPIPLRISQFAVIHTAKCFYILKEPEIDDFLKFPCFLCDPINVGNLISGSYAFSKPSLYIWRFSTHNC